MRDIESIFLAALELDAEAERTAYLDRACGGDADLRARVEKLLAAQARAGNFMRGSSAAEGAEPQATEEPGGRIGPYKLLQVLGEGGMGTVYLAEQTEPVARRVALKVIKPGMDTGEIVARFEAERQALALMDHPNIAKVFDAGTTDSGRPFFAMELVKGIPITEYCDQQNLKPRRRLELFSRVCHAVQHAHQKGIIHRDLKPANILVADYGQEAMPKVIDFGVAKATSQRLTDKTMYTQYGQLVGTLEYMSPEQVNLTQLDIDTRSDVYALGVVLYELLAGTTPFDKKRLYGSSFDEILRIIREDEPPRPSTRISTLGETAAAIASSRRSDPAKLRRVLRGELDWIVMRCLEKDRNRRYQSTAALAEDIERYLTGEAVHACPPSTGYRVRKFVGRHRGPVAAATALVLALCLGLTGTSLGFTQAVEAREAQQRLTFRMALDRGIALCDEGSVGHGMLWLARALELCPEDRPEMERVVRTNVNAWSRELHSLEAIFPHGEPVISVAISPDGRLLATGSNDNTAQLWDLRTGDRIGDPLPHTADVHEMKFSSDGSRLLTSDYWTKAFLWDTRTGELVHTFEHGTSGGEPCGDGCLGSNPSGVMGAAFRPPDDSQIVTSCGDGTVTVWDARSGERIRILAELETAVHDVAVSPDGSRILTADHRKNARLWDFDGKLLATFKHVSRVPAADFRGPDQIVTADADGHIFLWSVPDALAAENETLGQSAAVLVGRHLGVIHRVRVGRDGRILSACFDNTARVWNPDIEAGAAAGALFEQQAAVQSGAFDPDGVRIALACDDNAARLWTPAAGSVPTPLEYEGSASNAVYSYTTDGHWLLVQPEGDDDDESVPPVFVIDTSTGARLCELSREGAVRSVAVSPDRSKVLTGSVKSTTRMWDVATEELLWETVRQGSGIWPVAFNPDGTLTLVGDYDGSLEIRDARDGKLVHELTLAARVMGAEFSPDGGRIAVGSSDARARIFDAKDWSKPPLQLMGHLSSVAGATFSRDGARAVTASHDNTARVWDARTGTKLSDPMPHPGSIWYMTVAFSVDGRTVVTGCDDRAVRVWDVATSTQIGPALRHRKGVRMVAFASESQVRTGTTDGEVRVWNVTRNPLEGDVERIRRWIEVRTGLELDDEGKLRTMDAGTWHDRRARLRTLGGPPHGP